MRRGALWRLAIAGVALHDHEADGRERDGTACREQAEMADFHAAMRQDLLKEPADKFYDVKVGGA